MVFLAASCVVHTDADLFEDGDDGACHAGNIALGEGMLRGQPELGLPCMRGHGSSAESALVPGVV